MKNIAVFAILRDRPHADAGVKALVDNGFREEDISVLMAETGGSKDLAHEKHSKAPEGVALGALVGLLLVGTFGLLLGLGRIAVPALAGYAANGPIMCALAGVGAGGVVGGFIGMLFGLGVPEFEAKRYAGLIKEGRALLSVHCERPHAVKRAKNVLKSVGGQHVAAAAESGAGFVATQKESFHFRSAHGPAR
ncbi:MAG TPA: DUF3341 domain-containing protein [Bryobacteraceae bacterium]|jgi:hypothetical protein|nr:DUF3341 domain-containing protein [Bryobacteraceae bacterium]